MLFRSDGALEQRADRRPDQQIEDTQASDVRTRGSRIAPRPDDTTAGEQLAPRVNQTPNKCSATVGELDIAPSLQGCEQHEYVGHAVAHLLVIVADRLAGLGRDRFARLDDHLVGRFVQTDQKTIGIARLLAGFRSSSMAATKAASPSSRDCR